VSQAIAALCRRLTHGVYVIGVAHGAVHNAFTAAWVMPCSFDPLLLALAVHREHASYRPLVEGGAFAVSVLRVDQIALAAHFGQPEADKLTSIPWVVRRTGAPVLCDALAYFDCSLYGHQPAGDHELVLGRVVDGAILSRTPPRLITRARETSTEASVCSRYALSKAVPRAGVGIRDGTWAAVPTVGAAPRGGPRSTSHRPQVNIQGGATGPVTPESTPIGVSPVSSWTSGLPYSAPMSR
jgi:flavin reductase (DIM6/NTAB) family NADH-FMN oxidoreductase RutF